MRKSCHPLSASGCQVLCRRHVFGLHEVLIVLAVANLVGQILARKKGNVPSGCLKSPYRSKNLTLMALGDTMPRSAAIVVAL